MNEGLDCASFQHPNGAAIDYQAAAANLRSRGGGATPFVIVKIVEGLGYINPYWRQDVNGFANAGCAVAGYIFDLGLTNPAAEYAFARSIVGPGLPLVVDAETPQGLSPAAYAAHVAQVIGFEPFRIEYLNKSQAASGMLAAGDSLWLADYESTPSRSCMIHQYDNRGAVNGVQGPVDLDRWYGTQAEFANFFHLGSITPTKAPSGGGMKPLANGIDFAWTPTGKGYWECQSDGGIFTHGDAVFMGSLGNKHLTAPIVAIASHPTLLGYYMVGADGGVFSFGLPFYGSMGNTKLTAPITDIKVTPTGNGYALVAADGGMFTFGDAQFSGSGQ